MAAAQPLPDDHAIVHHLLQYYVLDDGSKTDNPIGLASKKLTAHFHQVYGLATRLQTTIRCVKELSIDVKNYALSSYATAQAVLTRHQKQLGAVVINLGGGVSDYIAYQARRGRAYRRARRRRRSPDQRHRLGPENSLREGGDAEENRGLGHSRSDRRRGDDHAARRL